MTTILTIIAALTAAIYLIYTIIQNKGIPDSISATAYVIKHKLTFTAAMIAECLLMLPSLLEKSLQNTQFLAFLSIVGLGMVGMSPDYKNENKLQHYIGAFLAGVGSQLLVGLNNPYILSTWALFPLTLIQRKNYTFWAEIMCFLNMFLYIII